MIRQHIFAIVHASAVNALIAIADQPTGNFVTVIGNDGVAHQVEELHGGFAYIGQRGAWIVVLASGTDAGFDAMRQVAPAGSVVELAMLTEGWSELDEAPAPIEYERANDWLIANGYSAIVDAPTRRSIVESIGGLFLDGFTINSVYVD